MANKKLQDFLKSLAQDARIREDYLSDPHGTMDKANVDQNHQDMIIRGDLDELKKELGSDDTYLIVQALGYKQ